MHAHVLVVVPDAVNVLHAYERLVEVMDPFGSPDRQEPRDQYYWTGWGLGGGAHGYWQLRPGVLAGAVPSRMRGPTILHEGKVIGADTVQEVDALCAAMLGHFPYGGDDPTHSFEGRADLARKGDIDFAAMRTLAAMEAETSYDSYERVTDGLEPVPRWEEYRDTRLADKGFEPYHNGFSQLGPEWAAMGEIRREYDRLPWIKALAEAKLMPWFGEPHDIWDQGREALVQQAVDSVLDPRALVADGTWHEPGPDQDWPTWLGMVRRRVEGLSDDAWLAILDIHR